MSEDNNGRAHRAASTPAWLKAVYASWAALIIITLIGTFGGCK